MGKKTRISIKLNDYEYSILYRIQGSCIMAGLSFDRAPPLNEIIKGLISFVAFDISGQSDSLITFARSIKTYSEYPEGSSQVLFRTPSKSGNYIFLADDEDVKVLNRIRDVVSTIHREDFEFPRLIRYCIHYTLYGDGFFQNKTEGRGKKGLVVMEIIVGNLYHLSPRAAIEIMNNPATNWRQLKSHELSDVKNIGLDLLVLDKAILLFGGSDNPQFYVPYSIKEEITPDKYQAYNSKVSDFNFLSLIFGCMYVSYMWSVDTFDTTMPTIIPWTSNKGLRSIDEADIEGFFKKTKERNKKNQERFAEKIMAENFLISPYYTFSYLSRAITTILDIFKIMETKIGTVKF